MTDEELVIKFQKLYGTSEQEKILAHARLYDLIFKDQPEPKNKEIKAQLVALQNQLTAEIIKYKKLEKKFQDYVKTPQIKPAVEQPLTKMQACKNGQTKKSIPLV